MKPYIVLSSLGGRKGTPAERLIEDSLLGLSARSARFSAWLTEKVLEVDNFPSLVDCAYNFFHSNLSDVLSRSSYVSALRNAGDVIEREYIMYLIDQL